jgi:hypothetical protein
MGREPSRKKDIQIDKDNAQSSQAENEQKTVSLMLSEHLTNLVEAIKKKKIFESLQRTEPKQKLKQRKIP